MEISGFHPLPVKERTEPCQVLSGQNPQNFVHFVNESNSRGVIELLISNPSLFYLFGYQSLISTYSTRSRAIILFCPFVVGFPLTALRCCSNSFLLSKHIMDCPNVRCSGSKVGFGFVKNRIHFFVSLAVLV